MNFIKNLHQYLVIFLLFISFLSEMEASIKAIIFDCDGVLVETEGIKYKAWKKVLQSRGVNLSDTNYRELVGLSGKDILENLQKKFQITLDSDILYEKNTFYKELQSKNVTQVDAMALAFHKMKTDPHINKLLFGVASSAGKNEIIYNLSFLKIINDFDIILSGKEDLSGYIDPLGVNKPKPYIYLEIALQLGIMPSECLVIEDSEPGVCSVKEAGCTVIAVPNHWTLKQNFENADMILIDANKEKIIQTIHQFL